LAHADYDEDDEELSEKLISPKDDFSVITPPTIKDEYPRCKA